MAVDGGEWKDPEVLTSDVRVLSSVRIGNATLSEFVGGAIFWEPVAARMSKLNEVRGRGSQPSRKCLWDG